MLLTIVKLFRSYRPMRFFGSFSAILALHFIERWKQLEELCDQIYHPLTGTPMDEAFTRYMYYERAKQGNKSSTTEALRRFYERNGYALLKKEETFDNIIDLAYFWNDVENQNTDRFEDNILRRLRYFMRWDTRLI